MIAGPGIYFDGITAMRHAAVLLLGPQAMQIASADGNLLDTWPYDEIEGLAAPGTALRIARRGNAVLARVVITDPEFAETVASRATNVDRTGVAQRRQRTSVIGWSIAATVSLVLVAYFGVPAIATRLAPLLPVALDRKLGAAVDIQLRSILDTNNTGHRSNVPRPPGAPRSTKSCTGWKLPPHWTRRCEVSRCADPRPTPWRCPAAKSMYFAA